MQQVVIDPNCFFTLVTASLEVYNRETTGLLVGNYRERKLNGHRTKVIVLEAAYPFQTAKRKPTWVDIGNISAFQRARYSLNSLSFPLVGEFHSHPNRPIGLSETDIKYIKERVRENYNEGKGMLNHYWLELIISVKKHRYKRPQKTGWKWKILKNKLTCLIKTTPFTGYKIHLAGFWVRIGNGGKQKIRANLNFPKKFYPNLRQCS